MSGAGSARHLAAIVAADVVGYSRLMGADEAGTLAALRACRSELLDPLVAAHDGRIVKSMGDGLLLTFTSVVEAVACALAIQRGMSERNRDVPAERRILWRIGITIGDVVVEDGDVFGDGVNQAARLEQLALPGGICIADDAWRQTRGRIDIEAVDGGSQRLKNIAGPIRVHHLATGSGGAGRPAERIHGALAHPARIAAAALAAVALVLVAAALWLRPDIPIWRMSPIETVVTRAPPIIAVLPFADLSAESERDYLADGLTAEVIAALGRFQSLRVIGRNAVMAFKGRPVTREEIASELGASYLVEGDLRRAGERVRLAAELTDAQSGTVLWSNRYEGELADVFDFQSTIAREVAGTLAAGITQIEARRRLEQPPPDPDAYGLFLQARAVGYATSRADNRRVRELASRAIELDPGYAMAHALLAEAIFSQAVNGWTEFVTREARRGEEHAHRAIALAPDEPDGYRALGRYHVLYGDYGRASEDLRRAIELNPSDAHALATWGAVLMYDGETTAATESLELALRYDPALEALDVFDLSLCYYLGHRHEDALHTALRGLARYPEFPALYAAAAAAAARLGRSGEAGRHAAELRRRLAFVTADDFGTRFRDPEQQAYLREGLVGAGL